MKNVIVTGSSGGIGKSLVLKLLNENYFVIGLDIIESDIENANFKFIKCDITSDESIKNAVDIIDKVDGSIYALFNISGIFMIESLIEGSTSDLYKIIDINFFGAHKIIKSLINKYDTSTKIILFTSEVARYSIQPFNGYYSLSKILIDKYADCIRRELNYLKIKVIKVQSGAIKTNLLTSVNDKYYTMVNNSTYYKKPLTKLKYLMDNEINKQTDPSVASNKLYKIMCSNHPKIRYKIKNSFKLSFLSMLPEKIQDIIYLNVIK